MQMNTRLVEYHLNNNNDFSSNICNFMSNLPRWYRCRNIYFISLKKIWKNEEENFREHLHLNYYDYKKKKNKNITLKLEL